MLLVLRAGEQRELLDCCACRGSVRFICEECLLLQFETQPEKAGETKAIRGPHCLEGNFLKFDHFISFLHQCQSKTRCEKNGGRLRHYTNISMISMNVCPGLRKVPVLLLGCCHTIPHVFAFSHPGAWSRLWTPWNSPKFIRQPHPGPPLWALPPSFQRASTTTADRTHDSTLGKAEGVPVKKLTRCHKRSQVGRYICKLQ